MAAFLAATLLPFSSEAVFAGLLWRGEHPWWLLWLVATGGNVLGSWCNWLLGRYCGPWIMGRAYFKKETVARAQAHYTRFGHGSLLFAWLPVVGDPLTFVAGLFRVPWPMFLALVTVGKGGRYGLIVAAMFL